MSVTSSPAVVTLPSATEILITRAFDAPRQLVYKAWTTPELVRQWWNPHGEMTVAEIDLRVGGRWRYAMQEGDTEIAFHGEFRELVENERIVNTEVFEMMPDNPALNVVTFTEADGRTTLELLVRCEDEAQRDAIIQSGMETGMQKQMVQLDELLLTLR